MCLFRKVFRFFWFLVDICRWVISVVLLWLRVLWLWFIDIWWIRFLVEDEVIGLVLLRRLSWCCMVLLMCLGLISWCIRLMCRVVLVLKCLLVVN